ncbi:MAG TPA: hypothetical protein VGJ04_10645 [Pirellulales bacterium]
MIGRALVSLAIAFLSSFAVHAQSALTTLQPYLLPAAAQHSVEDLAAQSDVLILGEMHGTQEVPQVAAALLTPLTKLGYQVLAIEVPSDQQQPLIAWATGKTDKVPSFYAEPWTDGRGNVQMLSLIRTALSTPYRWKLICFDESIADAQKQYESLKRQVGPETLKKPPTPLSLNALPDWIINDWQQRDASMASNFGKQFHEFARQAKVLAICGNLHARTANPPAAEKFTNHFWPSFAAIVQSKHPTWHVDSININYHSGAFFNDGKVNQLGGKPIAEPQANPLRNGDWNLELNLSHATPATFLATPADPDMAQTAPKPLSSPSGTCSPSSRSMPYSTARYCCYRRFFRRR